MAQDENRTSRTPAARKVVLLAGSAHGIGRAAAIRFAGNGHILAACDKDAAGLDELKAALRAGCDAFLARVDITELSAVTAFVNATKARYGRIDAAICNAGGMISLVADGIVEANIRNFLDIPTTDWRAIVDLNLYGALNLSHAVLPIMVAQGQGRLVLVSSVSGVTGAGGLSVYSAAKGGVIAFAKSLAREFASKGVSVNCVAPGGVATRAFPTGAASSGKRLERIAIGRLADPDEVANVISYLALEAPQYLVGDVIAVSGGPP
jgi:NAD(P)-dependent dehydrogenase (short-subunit alcohol dehydrogenase family)